MGSPLFFHRETMESFITTVRQFICKNALFDDSRMQIVALSGGADSVALLRIMLQLGYKCHAVHCNFHLRGDESMRDEFFVRDLCGKLSVPLHVENFDTDAYAESQGVSIEMAARELRYSLFEKLRLELGAEHIAVAHHRDDSVETVIMNLVRGTGLRGLTGIKPLNGNIARPLLCVSRTDIEEYLKTLGQNFIIDSTNLQTEYRRNKIRHIIIPELKELNPSVEKSIVQTSTRLQQAYTLYYSAVKKAIERILSEDGSTIRVNTTALFKEEAHETIAFELLNQYGFTESQISDILQCANGTAGKKFRSTTHILITDRDYLLIRPYNENHLIDTDIDLSIICLPTQVTVSDSIALEFTVIPACSEIIRDNNVAMIDADLAGTRLKIRSVQNADSFIPFGMNGKQSLADYMTNRKYSLFQKQDQLVVCNDDAIVWVVGQRIDNRYRVTSQTKHILVIRKSKKS